MTEGFSEGKEDAQRILAVQGHSRALLNHSPHEGTTGQTSKEAKVEGIVRVRVERVTGRELPRGFLGETG